MLRIGTISSMNENGHGFKVTRNRDMQWPLVHAEKQASRKRGILGVGFDQFAMPQGFHNLPAHDAALKHATQGMCPPFNGFPLGTLLYGFKPMWR